MSDETIIMLGIDEVRPYENNPRINDDAVDRVAASIREFGFKQPIVVDSDRIIIAGHTRWRAAQQLGLEKIPVIIASDLTEEQARAYRLADNKVAEAALWDYDKLDQELAAILDIDMGEFGFTDEDDALLDEPLDIIEDEAPEVDMDKEPVVKLGEIWRCGDHVLLCGDATDEEQVRRLVAQGGGQADMVFTDPPYNVALASKNRTLNQIQPSNRILRPIIQDGDDGQTDDDVSRTLWLPAFRNLRSAAKDQCSIYVTMPQGRTHATMMDTIEDAGWQVKHELMWLKNAPTFSMNRLDYDYQHEPILYGWNKTHKWVGGGEFNKSVWPIDRLAHCDLHPTMKPIKLIANAIQNSSEQGDIVLDVFGGSGSTMIACEQTGRRCLMMELDPHYCDVIIQRWEQLTGDKAERIAGASV